MKLAPVVETTDFLRGPAETCGCIACGQARPMVTEADLIAAAAPAGEVTIRPMAVVKSDDAEASAEGWDDPVFDEMKREEWANMLHKFEVTWDPEIRL